MEIKNDNPARILVGTSGYAYSEWVDAGFYPPGTGSARMLAHYARVFPITEINYTWYQMPKAHALERMCRHVPACFRFAVKLNRTLTHEVDSGQWRAQAAQYREGLRYRPDNVQARYNRAAALELVGDRAGAAAELRRVLEERGEDLDLVRVLTEPKNALVRQYQSLFEMENCELGFTEDALRAIAVRAQEKDTGARGLRTILEEVMLDIMYELPSVDNVKECVVSEDVVLKKEAPILLFDQTKNKKQA